jgi:putative sugar O-methyltransferase
MHETAYALTEFYIRSIDTLGLLEKLSEDGLFGVSTFVLNTKAISRDLLDSILEMYFLEKHLGLFSRQKFNVLDIGAGYGRLAHRMTTAVPGLNAYLCTDGIAVSTFICEYYLSFRELSDGAKVAPLDEVESAIEVQPVDLAINVLRVHTRGDRLVALSSGTPRSSVSDGGPA